MGFYQPHPSKLANIFPNLFLEDIIISFIIVIFRVMIAVTAVMLVTITVISFPLIEQSNKEQAYAQNQTQGGRVGCAWIVPDK